MKTPDLEILLSIPEVVLRHRPNQRSHFVYRICVSISPLNEEGLLTPSDPALEWVVGHRYSTLSELHNDLMGQTVETFDGVELGSKTKIECYAHGCLPRPLPGLNQLSFPQKHLIPTVPGLVVCRFSPCSDPVCDEERNADILVSKPTSSRLEKRRSALETYLRDLISLVWTTATLGSVASVFSAMNVEAGRQMISPQCKKCIESKHLDIDCHICTAFHKLTSLLPILAPNDILGDLHSV